MTSSLPSCPRGLEARDNSIAFEVELFTLESPFSYKKCRLPIECCD